MKSTQIRLSKSFSYITNNIQLIPFMDDHTYQNWIKIKQTFEESGNIDNMFYKRACEIIKTKRDPLEKFWNKGK